MTDNKEARRTMLSKKVIAKIKGIQSETCQGCGFEPHLIHRCHIHPVCKGGANDVDNILLLCPFCHAHIQEYFTFDNYDVDYIKTLFKQQHMPFFNIKANHFIDKINNGLIPKKIYNKLAKDYDLDKLKNIHFYPTK